MRSGLVSYGFFSNFKGADSVVFSGDRPSLRKFASLLRSLSRSAKGHRVLFSELNFFEHAGGMAVAIEICEDEESFVLREDNGLGNLAVWKLGPRAATHCAEKLGSLLESEHGHQYLEDKGSIQVLVSTGEYDDLVFS